MLSRFCIFSLRFVKYKHIASNTYGYLAPAPFVLSRKSNYATENNNDYAKTIENHTTAGNLEDALKILKQASTNNEIFKLDCIKIAELVKLMVEKNYPFEEVETILSAHSPGLDQSNPDSRFALFEKLFSRMAISGQVQLIQKLFDTLIKYNYIEATIETTGCLVKASLHIGLYAQAVDMYEYVDKTYQIYPKTMVLFIQLIQQKEDDLLHRVYKLYEQRCGIRKALRELGFAYSEHGYDRQAKETFEKINDDISKDIINQCRHYIKFEKSHMARSLLTATKGLNCNRGVIYETILDIYIKKNKADEALKLWHEYTSDDILPTQTFKKKLAALLNTNCMKVPLDLDLKNDKKKIDSHTITPEGNTTETETLLAKENIILNNNSYAMSIENYITAGNLENALDMLKQASKNNESVKLDCQKVVEFIKFMVERKYPFEEIEAILSDHSPGLGPSKHKSRFFLFENLIDRLVITGQMQLLKQLFDTLIKYNYIEANVESTRYLVKAFLNNGAYAEAVDISEHFAKTYQLVSMTKILFIELIQQNKPDLLKRHFELCEQMFSTQMAYQKLGFAFVECGRDQQAKMIFEKVHLFWKDVILECQGYVKYGRLQKARTLLTATKELNCNRDVIYEAILDIYIKQNRSQDALNLWREYTNDELIQSQTFKNKLVTLLKANRMEIPLNLNLNEKKEK